jgi:2-keto-4-pentenoate hydratase/2-oxohepta-3-ene-1,7-dioic acid hydratase in catechol pathway
MPDAIPIDRRGHTLAFAPPGAEAIPLAHILGIGRNYVAHASEQGAKVPERPMVFTKNPASATLDGEDIVIPTLCQDEDQTDYEGELAVVIGRAARDVSEAEAADPGSGVVLGYCAANDVSARWWQKKGSGGQFCRGKGFDTFCPLGPAVVPAGVVEEWGGPSALTVRTLLNGEVVQDEPTGNMVFSPTYLVAELSRGTTLLPGTVILTGTPTPSSPPPRPSPTTTPPFCSPTPG